MDLPGFEREEIDVRWQDGRLAVAAEHDDENRRRTSHRTFRFLKGVDDGAIEAEYANGVLDIWLPIADTVIEGKEIEVR